MGAKTGDKSPKVEKVSKKDKSEKKSKKDSKSAADKQEKIAKAAAVSLLADKKAVNPALSSLFAAQVSAVSRVLYMVQLLTKTAYTSHSPGNCTRA